MHKLLGASVLAILAAGPANAQQIGDVFYIALENHNFMQPSSVSSPGQIFGNAAAPFINSLVTPGNPNAADVSYASNYQNVYPGLHPSEPNYVWQVSGVHGPLNDADPYPANIVNAPNLGQLLQSKSGASSWKAYQEDTDLLNTLGQNANAAHGALTNTVAPQNQWEVPLTSFSGTNSTYTNPYNGSDQWNYAAKHDPFVFFTATNGGDNSAPSNPLSQNYAPLQQLASDLADGKVGRFNWITPDQYNDMHTALTGGFTYDGTHWTGDEAQIAQGDNFLSMVVPMIEASSAFQHNGAIVIWNDETEGDEGAGSTAGFTSTEIVISPLAKGNAYTNDIYYTHSSDLVTWQNVFHLPGPDGGYLGAAGGANSLADLFQSGVIPSSVPETGTWAMMLMGLAGLGGASAAFGRKGAARPRRLSV